LVREQSVITTDAATASRNIDGLTGTLQDTHDWMREKQEIFGGLTDSLSEAPAVLDTF